MEDHKIHNFLLFDCYTVENWQVHILYVRLVINNFLSIIFHNHGIFTLHTCIRESVSKVQSDSIKKFIYVVRGIVRKPEEPGYRGKFWNWVRLKWNLIVSMKIFKNIVGNASDLSWKFKYLTDSRQIYMTNDPGRMQIFLG